MPEHRELPLFRWGEELRRDRRGRRVVRLKPVAAAAAAVAVTAILVTLSWQPRPVLLWNASASSPVGLYLVRAPAQVRRGQVVVAWAPAAARGLAASRHYLPANVPLVKRVAAVAGDRICASGDAVLINGRVAARRRGRDGAGRPLTWWTGCVDLRDGDLFLLAPDIQGSFDGRYFGVTHAVDVVGRARLIWAG